MVEVKRKVVKEVEEVIQIEIERFYVVRVIEDNEYKGKVCIAEKEYEFYPTTNEIAEVLIDYNDKKVFASVLENYRLVEVEK